MSTSGFSSGLGQGVVLLGLVSVTQNEMRHNLIRSVIKAERWGRCDEIVPKCEKAREGGDKK